MYAICGHTARRWRTSPMSPPSTVIEPSCSCFDPAISASKVDLPTPSGPTIPTMRPGGMSRSMLSRPLTLPYRCETFLTDTTGPLADVDIGADSLGIAPAGLAILLRTSYLAAVGE